MMMKMTFLVCLSSVSIASISFASTVRTSQMNEDIVISQTLYNALQTSADVVPNIVTSGHNFSLIAGLDKLVCDSAVCKLSWDSSSAEYSQSSVVFQGALYDTLDRWSKSGGVTDPNLHRSVYVQTETCVGSHIIP